MDLILDPITWHMNNMLNGISLLSIGSFAVHHFEEVG